MKIIAPFGLVCVLVGCGAGPQERLPAAPAGETAKPDRASLANAICANWQDPLGQGAWKETESLRTCLRQLALDDRPKARIEAAHILKWELGKSRLSELVASLERFESTDDLRAYLDERRLLDGEGIEYGDPDRPLMTAKDFLLRHGRINMFDAETGMFPNYHDALLRDLAELFGAPMGSVEFTEQAPEEDTEDPYELRAQVGDKLLTRPAQNYGDWYDVDAVVALLNEVAAELQLDDRAVFLPTYDQAVTVLVGPGASIADAVRDRVFPPRETTSAMDTGKDFERQVLESLRLAPSS
jgi:hypothetical protein